MKTFGEYLSRPDDLGGKSFALEDFTYYVSQVWKDNGDFYCEVETCREDGIAGVLEGRVSSMVDICDARELEDGVECVSAPFYLRYNW